LSVEKAAQAAVRECLDAKPSERALIILNHDSDLESISAALFDVFQRAEVKVEKVIQSVRTHSEDISQEVMTAMKAEPDIIISLSRERLGRDPEGRLKPYIAGEKSYDHLLHYLISGKKVSRGFWSPGITKEIFSLGGNIDYKVLREEASMIKKKLDHAVSVRLTSPGGTDISFSIEGRKGFLDDGDFRTAGLGGNFPAGESFVSPVVGTAQGVAVFDGSLALGKGTEFCKNPVTARWTDGFLRSIEGKGTGEKLVQIIDQTREKILQDLAQGLLSKETADDYSKNTGNLGELGIGLNPGARLMATMLIDEKVRGTCHLAIGSNYDNDAFAPLHLDGVILRPTLELTYRESSEYLLIEGRPQW